MSRTYRDFVGDQIEQIVNAYCNGYAEIISNILDTKKWKCSD